jgi:hypothetical protein
VHSILLTIHRHNVCNPFWGKRWMSQDHLVWIGESYNAHVNCSKQKPEVQICSILAYSIGNLVLLPKHDFSQAATSIMSSWMLLLWRSLHEWFCSAETFRLSDLSQGH